MTISTQSIEDRAINTIRGLSMDAVQQANAGHPGTPMALAPLAYVLWTRVMKFNPANPNWFNRDRFILSAGHASMLQYAILHLTGYDLSLNEIRNFRQMGSLTPGHPESDLTGGIEVTTGPLGQGFGNAVGMAMAERWLAATYNRPDHQIVDHRTYVIASDGDMMEGISHEAGSLAGHLGLGKLIVMYDDNNITIEGSTDLAFSEDVVERFDAYGWHTLRVDDVNELSAVETAIQLAEEETDRPSLIAIQSHIGYGSPNKQDTSDAHGAPLGPDEVKLTKENLGIQLEPTFHIAEDVYEHFDWIRQRGAEQESEWNDLLSRYKNSYRDLAESFVSALNGELPAGWDADLPVWEASDSGPATRVASGDALNSIAERVPNLIGGSADLAGSNNTDIVSSSSLSKTNPTGRIIHFGVREHVMGAALTGINLHGGLRGFGGTFLIFSDYMRNSIRLAAMQEVPSIFVFTHDSIGLGEDGPTHQPVEQLMSLRAIPNLLVIRPADANETSRAWSVAMEQRNRPVALVLTRQGLPVFEGSNRPADQGVARGGYVISRSDSEAQALIVATGSEVSIAVAAQQLLDDRGVPSNVVSIPCWELFDEQPIEYRESVLPPDISNKVSVEAGATLGWERYVGAGGTIVGLDQFGASAPYLQLYERFGITADRVADAVSQLDANGR